jgi:hypothetical protein
VKKSAEPYPFITLETEEEVQDARTELTMAAQQADTDPEAFLATFRKLAYAYDKKLWKPKRTPSIGFEWLAQDNNVQILRHACGSMTAFFTPLFEYLSNITPHVLSPEFLALLDADELEPFVRVAACSLPTLPVGIPWVKNLAAAGISESVIAEIVLDRLEKADTENPGPTAFYVGEFLSTSCNDAYFVCADTPRCTSTVGCFPQWQLIPNGPTQWSVLSKEQLLQAMRICMGHKQYSTQIFGGRHDPSLYHLLLEPQFTDPADRMMLMEFLRDLLLVLPDIGNVSAHMVRFMPFEYITTVLKHRTDCFVWAVRHAIDLKDAGLLDLMLTRHGKDTDPKTVFTTYCHEASRWDIGAKKLLAYAISVGFQTGELISSSRDTGEVRTDSGVITLVGNCPQQPVGTTVLFHPEVRTPASGPCFGSADTPYYTSVR